MEKTVTVFIDTGWASVNNGATGPLNQYFELAEAAGIEADPGDCYGDDRLTVNEADWPALEALLIEAKLLYRVCTAEPWKNRRPRG